MKLLALVGLIAIVVLIFYLGVLFERNNKPKVQLTPDDLDHIQRRLSDPITDNDQQLDLKIHLMKEK